MSEFAVCPSLKGKTVFVTGGASGLGAEIVRAFVTRGARVGFLDRDEAAAAAQVVDLGGAPVHATAKAGVLGVTRTMVRDPDRHRIRGNAVAPGRIMTERQKEPWVTAEALAKQPDGQCLPDLIDPVYVARKDRHLASDDAAMCSANNFMVEGRSI